MHVVVSYFNTRQFHFNLKSSCGASEVSTHRESLIRKSPSFPCKSNLKESLLSPETISPNSQILGQQWEWRQESECRHPEEEIHLLGFPTSYRSRQDFSLFFFPYKHLPPLLLYLQHSYTDMRLFRF